MIAQPEGICMRPCDGSRQEPYCAWPNCLVKYADIAPASPKSSEQPFSLTNNGTTDGAAPSPSEKNSPLTRSAAAFPQDYRRKLEESNLPIEVATAIADRLDAAVSATTASCIGSFCMRRKADASLACITQCQGCSFMQRLGMEDPVSASLEMKAFVRRIEDQRDEWRNALARLIATSPEATDEDLRSLADLGNEQAAAVLHAKTLLRRIDGGAKRDGQDV